MTQTPDPVWDKLVALSACLCQSVADEEGLADLCYCGPVPGDNVAYDYIANSSCLDNETDGMGWVRLSGAYTTQNFPAQLTLTTACDQGYLAFAGEAGILRTMPMTADGEPPTAEVMLAATSRQITEMVVIRKAILCCYGKDVILGQYVPRGPAGSAIGGYWTFIASTDTDDDD